MKCVYLVLSVLFTLGIVNAQEGVSASSRRILAAQRDGEKQASLESCKENVMAWYRQSNDIPKLAVDDMFFRTGEMRGCSLLFSKYSVDQYYKVVLLTLGNLYADELLSRASLVMLDHGLMEEFEKRMPPEQQ